MFAYSEETDDDPAQYTVTAAFNKSASVDVGFNASLGVGDLLSITVEEGSSLSAQTDAYFSTTFGVILAPDTTEQLVILGDVCNGEAGFNCTTTSETFFMLSWVDEGIDGDVTQTQNYTLLPTSNVTEELSDKLGDLATVDQVGTSLLAIKFQSNISAVTLSVLKVSSKLL